MERRHDLDWLRILLFALLVPHHVAVGFVDWGVDIYQFVNNNLAGDGMTLFIYWSHSWRLPSLFLISGIGTYFLTRRGFGLPFMAGRIGRLMIPVIFGFFVLNAFGGYAIAVMTGDTRDFPVFWSDWLADPAPGQVQHLWFLFNLILYTLLCWPIFALRTRMENLKLTPAVLISGLVSASAVAIVIVKPHAAALTGDGYQFGYYLTVFAGGYMIGARHHDVLEWVERNAWILLAMAIALFIAKSTLLTLVFIADIATGKALAAGVDTTRFGAGICKHVLGDRSSHGLGMVSHCTRLGRKIFEYAEPLAGRAQSRNLSTLCPTFPDHTCWTCVDSANIMAVVDRVLPVTHSGLSLQLGALACR